MSELNFWSGNQTVAGARSAERAWTGPLPAPHDPSETKGAGRLWATAPLTLPMQIAEASTRRELATPEVGNVAVSRSPQLPVPTQPALEDPPTSSHT